MAPHSSTLAWKIPWTEEPGRPQSMGVARIRTRLSDFTFTFHFHALEKEMATHSSVLTWRIPGTGEPGGLPSLGSHRVGHNWSDLAAAAAAYYCFPIDAFPLPYPLQSHNAIYLDPSHKVTLFSHNLFCMIKQLTTQIVLSKMWVSLDIPSFMAVTNILHVMYPGTIPCGTTVFPFFILLLIQPSLMEWLL